MNAPFVVSGELTVFTAHGIKATLIHAMPHQGLMAIDLGSVSEFDGAGLQLLLATAHEARARNVQLVLCSPPKPVRTVLHLAGLSSHFQIATSGEGGATP
jgi:anti-anti-sigma factor